MDETEETSVLLKEDPNIKSYVPYRHDHLNLSFLHHSILTQKYTCLPIQNIPNVLGVAKPKAGFCLMCKRYCSKKEHAPWFRENFKKDLPSS